MRGGSHRLAGWVRARKDANDLDLALMALQFDLEGALDAGQFGLAWISQERILQISLQLYVAQRDGETPSSANDMVAVTACVDRIEKWNAPLAERAWELLLRSPALTPDEVGRAAAEALTFISEDLGISAVATRTGATRAWAEGVDTLRRVAAHAGLAASGSWYIPRPDGEADLSWLDDVLSTLEGGTAQAGATSRVHAAEPEV